MSDPEYAGGEFEPDPQPVIPDNVPLFTEDARGRLTIEWPDDRTEPVLMTREALQMLVDRANQGRPKLT